MIRKSVEDLGTGKDVEADEHDVIEKQHDASEFIGDSALSKGVVPEITYITVSSSDFQGLLSHKLMYCLTDIHNLRVLHNEFVHGNGGDPEEDTGENHGDNTRYPS